MIESTVNETEKKKDKFPLLMKGIVTNVITYWPTEKEGFCIAKSPAYEMGAIFNGDCIGNFKPFTGSITLRNK